MMRWWFGPILLMSLAAVRGQEPGRLYNANTLDEVWPREKPYGTFFWEMDEGRPNDVKVVQ
jgi:hypothetical protein